MDWDRLLDRAADLADRGRGEVEPNPRVGALAILDGKVVGEGWHQYWGGPHAEEKAIGAARDAGHEVDTVVVTLEPCSSAGPDKKRPSCTNLLTEVGVRRVCVGCLDPDPRHQGRGLDLLREAGIQVDGPRPTDRLDRLLVRFRRWLSSPRPWVLAKWAMTLDGKTATHTRHARWISGEAALVRAHVLRARADGVMVGIGTALADDPELTVRLTQGQDPVRIIVDPDAQLRLDAKLWQTIDRAPVWVVVREGADQSRRDELEKVGARLFVVPEVDGRLRVDVPHALADLRRNGIQRLVVEGGSALLGQLYEGACFDQVVVVVAPKLCGGRAALTPVGGTGIETMDEALMLEEHYSTPLGDCVEIGGFVG